MDAAELTQNVSGARHPSLPLSSLAPTVASHSAIGLSQGRCWLLVYRPSPGDQQLVHVGTNASTLLPSRMSLKGHPILRAPAEC